MSVVNHSSRRQLALVIATGLVLGLSLIGSPYPRAQALQHAPSVIALALLAVSARRGWLTHPASFCLIVFLWLHILGARYIYSFVPYDDWSRSVLGSSISEWFGWQRNHYDRLVHLCFGGLGMVAVAETVLDRGRISVGQAVLWSFLLVTTISGVYEIFEWLLTEVVSPARAQEYNGQQGDPWDAQKDMVLALVGSLMAIPVVTGLYRSRARSGS
jgi:putative membrane protein